MSITFGFLFFLVITLCLLAAVVWTGFRALRRRHISLALCAVLSLVITIVYAERLGTLYDLESSGVIYPIHLLLAKTTAAAYLLPLIFGPLTIRDRKWLPLHKNLAFLVLFLTLVTAITGSAMVLMSERLEPPLPIEASAPVPGK